MTGRKRRRRRTEWVREKRSEVKDEEEGAEKEEEDDGEGIGGWVCRGLGEDGGIYVTVSRSTPTVAGDLLIVGIYRPAVVIAVTRLTGLLVWISRLDPRPLAQITASGTFYLGKQDHEVAKEEDYGVQQQTENDCTQILLTVIDCLSRFHPHTTYTNDDGRCMDGFGSQHRRNPMDNS
ncbi:hypothetical protein ACH5RR_006299 [Cinchona calisaya]|uniref:Uncharacterized protein n=1 Tax=Cinchona calisaya TaxID=153742 RepID=A0ABD3ANL4_9GENT